MTIFHRHILIRVLRTYVLLIGGLVVFFILLHYLEYIDDFLDRKAPLAQLHTEYYPSYVPEIVRLISPLALFLAVVYVTGALAQTLQIITLQTGGVSLSRLIVPYIWLGLTLSVLMVGFNGYVAPITNQTVLRWDALYLKDAPRRIDVSDVYRQNGPSGTLLVGYFDRRAGIAYQVVLQHFDGAGRLIGRVDAQQMMWRDSLWHLPHATARTFGPRMEHRRELADVDTVLMVLPRDLARTERDIEAMTLPVAREYVASLRRTGATSIGGAEVGYYTKFTYPLAHLVVVLLAVPIALRRRRGGQAMRVGLGLLLAFCYLAAQKLIEPFGYFGDLHPAATAILPHLLFALAALAMMARTRR